MIKQLAVLGVLSLFVYQVWGNPFAPADYLGSPKQDTKESQPSPSIPKYSGFWINDGIITAFIVQSGLSTALKRGEASAWGKVQEITTEKVIFEKNGKRVELLIDR